MVNAKPLRRKPQKNVQINAHEISVPPIVKTNLKRLKRKPKRKLRKKKPKQKVSEQYRFLEHTADIRLQVWGKTLEELFENAALGMMEYLFGEYNGNYENIDSSAVEIEAPDKESLLVDWLSELLCLTNTNYKRVVKFDLAIKDNTRLLAKIGAIKANAIEDIKAVTYSFLKIENENGLFETIITFDI